jgi:hypothetical protein
MIARMGGKDLVGLADWRAAIWHSADGLAFLSRRLPFLFQWRSLLFHMVLVWGTIMAVTR